MRICCQPMQRNGSVLWRAGEPEQEELSVWECPVCHRAETSDPTWKNTASSLLTQTASLSVRQRCMATLRRMWNRVCRKERMRVVAGH